MPETPQELPPADETPVLAEATAPLLEEETSLREGGTPESAQTAHVPETTKEHDPMLDVHPAHHAASTWKEFFIHIATIVLGLIIAVSLEQTVEYFHRQHERRQLEDDLRAEAEGRIPLETGNLKVYAVQRDWDREVVQRGRVAAASGGFVTFVLPDRQQSGFVSRPEDAAWPAAKASGLAAVLPNEEVEAWDRVDYYAQMVARDSDERNKAGEAFRSVADRLGVSVAPGATVRVTPEERDELMRALALWYEKMLSFNGDSASWQGASDAAAHGALTVEQMQPYIVRARAAMPK